MSEDSEPMIEMTVTGIALDLRSGLPLVLLNDAEQDYTLPIWIGHAEAQAIARALEGIETERPLTHDLMLNAIDVFTQGVESIEIHSFENSTFYASLNLRDEEDNLITMDSRPSDAIAIALRAEARIYVKEELLFQDIEKTAEIEEQEAKEFQDFLKDVKASDFTLKGQGDN